MSNKFKLWFDAAMLITLCLLYNSHATGLAFHEITGLVLGGAVIFHVLFNMDWVIGISKKIFSKGLNWKTRFSYVLNIILLIDMCFIVLSGLLISKIVTPNFRIFTSVNWFPIHIFSTTLGLVIVGVHIGLHWNWIKQMGSRVPKLANLFSFNKPLPKVVSLIILLIGTAVLFGQVSKMVSIAPAIFSNSVISHEQDERDFEKAGDFKPTDADNQNNQIEKHRDFKKGNDFDERKEAFSGFQLLENASSIILYSSAFASMAFYTHLITRRRQKQL